MKLMHPFKLSIGNQKCDATDNIDILRMALIHVWAQQETRKFPYMTKALLTGMQTKWILTSQSGQVLIWVQTVCKGLTADDIS